MGSTHLGCSYTLASDRAEVEPRISSSILGLFQLHQAVAPLVLQAFDWCGKQGLVSDILLGSDRINGLCGSLLCLVRAG